MSGKSGIEWTETTWNPTAGCDIVSPGCTNCYAMQIAHRLQNNPMLKGGTYRGLTKKTKAGPVWTGRVTVSKNAVLKPLRWRKPRLVFVNSMSDVFHEALSSSQIARVWAVMAIARQHTFQVLTKRPEKMLAWLSDPATRFAVELAMRAIDPKARLEGWPLANVWCGTSVEDQRRADERIPILLKVPAAVRFLSVEPLLGPVDLEAAIGKGDFRKLDWVIGGGESGRKARPMHPAWARAVRDACTRHGTRFFFKQVGSWAWVNDRMAKEWLSLHGERSEEKKSGWQGIRRGAKKAGGRKLDGRLWEEMPSPRQPSGDAPARRKAA